jgi:hypothetical protein
LRGVDVVTGNLKGADAHPARSSMAS